MLHLLKGEKQEPNSDFKPNLVNTVCFLVQFIIQLITFGVNYQVRRHLAQAVGCVFADSGLKHASNSLCSSLMLSRC